MNETTHPLLAREGWVHVALALALAAGVHWLAGPLWALPFWVILVFVLQFFRDPVRSVPGEAGLAVCPADGRVIVVDQVQDPYLQRPARRVSIFMNVFNVHSNRSPVAGTVQQRWYHRGRFFNAALDKAAMENERNALWIKTDDGQDVVFVQVAGLIARRILCYADQGTRLARGQRYGFIRFGSRVDIYLPPDSRVQVSLGDKVKSGRDVLAILPR
jgi:phosphatidylserine decarboxylase